MHSLRALPGLAMLIGCGGFWPPPGLAAPPDQSPEPITPIERDNNRTLTMRSGDQLRIVLRESAGTGYSWQIEEIDPTRLKSLGNQSRPEPPLEQTPGRPPLVGGPLQHAFLFRCLRPGATRLSLRHWRVWEGPNSVDRRFTVKLRILAP